MRDLSHLTELDESLKDWERYQRYSLEDLQKDRDKRNMVLHAMLVGIQAAIDIGSHLISLKERYAIILISMAEKSAITSFLPAGALNRRLKASPSSPHLGTC